MVKTKKAATTREQEQVTDQAIKSFKQEETPEEKAAAPAAKDATEAAAAKTKKVLVSVKAEETKEPQSILTHISVNPKSHLQALMRCLTERAQWHFDAVAYTLDIDN